MKVVAGDWKGRASRGRGSIILPTGVLGTERLAADAVASCVVKSRTEREALVELTAADGRIAIIECCATEDLPALLALGEAPEPMATPEETGSAAASVAILLLALTLLAATGKETLARLTGTLEPRPARAAATSIEAIETGAIPMSGAEADAAALVAGTPGLARHRRLFVKAAESLIASGRCAPSDFRQQGGWRPSPGAADVYHVDCGWILNAARITLNARTGEIR